MTERELAEMLRNNPDLGIVDDGTRNYIPPVQENGDRNHPSINGTAKPKVKRSEHDLQCAIVAECDKRAKTQPEYGLLFAIPNGQYRQGQRMEPGLRPGVPDLFLPVARHGYHGFFIELKVTPNKPPQTQQQWLRNLRTERYLCKVVWDSVDEAVGLIEWYLEGAR